MTESKPSEPSVRLSSLAAVGAAVVVGLHGAIMLGFAFALTHTVPRFKQIFADMAVELPALTLLLIRCSDWLKLYWYVLLPAAAVVLGVDAVVFWLLTRRRRTWLLGAAWLLVTTVVGGGVALALLVLGLFLPLVTLMQNIGQG